MAAIRNVGKKEDKDFVWWMSYFSRSKLKIRIRH